MPLLDIAPTDLVDIAVVGLLLWGLVAWTRRVKVVDELSGAPKAGVAVHAESMPGSAVPIRVEGRTGPDGVAELVHIGDAAGESRHQERKHAALPFGVKYWLIGFRINRPHAVHAAHVMNAIHIPLSI